MPIILSGSQGISRSGSIWTYPDTSGRMLNPNQPCFMASGSFTLSSTVVINYSSVYYNVGNHYVNSTGRFTAPVTGTYLFTSSFLSQNANTYMLWNFHRNNGVYTSGYHQSYNYGTGNDSQTTGAIIAQLTAGDFIDVRFHPSYQNVYTSGYSYFSGYMLS